MKYLIILIFASTCTGCAGSKRQYAGQGGPFVIEYYDDMEQEVILLSIRDSGIVVIPPSEMSETNPTFQKTFFISKDSIANIRHKGLTGFSTSGGVGGGVAGAAVLGLVSVIGNKPSPYIHFSDGEAFIIGAIPGALIGGVVGSIANISQSNFSLVDPDDREKLISLCKYCGHEPDYIDAIK